MTSRDQLTRRRFVGKLGAAGLAGALGLPVDLARRLDAATAETARRSLPPVTIFSKHLQWLDLEGMASAAAALGFDGIDLTVRPGGHVLPERVEDDLPLAVEAARAAGVEIRSIVTAITDPGDPRTEPILRTAGGLGVPSYRLGYWRYQPERPIPAQLDELRPRARDLTAMNAALGLRGEYQNHAGTFYVGASVWDLWSLFEGLDPRWMGCQFDIRHATVEGGTTWPILTRLMAPRTGTVVAKDFRWVQGLEGWRVQDSPLGQGMVTFEPYFQLLRQEGFSGSVILHLEYPLGGAEHGATELTIPRQLFSQQVGADLALLRHWLSSAGFGS